MSFERYKYDDVLEFIAKTEGIPLSSNIIAEQLDDFQNLVAARINYLLKKGLITRKYFGTMSRRFDRGEGKWYRYYFLKRTYNLYELTPSGIERVKRYKSNPRGNPK